MLGQRVSGLSLSTHEEKVKAILDLEFPKSLKDLEHYLGLTNWVRHNIPYYSQIIAPLQERKVELLKNAPAKGNACKAFARKTLVAEAVESRDPAQVEAFEILQEFFRGG